MTEGRFTIECQRIFRHATTMASDLGHPAVGTEHLLLATLAVPSTAMDVLAKAGVDEQRVWAEVAARTRTVSDEEALRALGIDAASVRAEVETAFGAGAFDQRPPWTELAQQVLLDAARMCEADADDRGLADELHIIGTDWLFLALLDRDEGVAADVLATFGIDRAAIVADIARQTPVVTRFREAMLGNPVHGRYRALLAAWAALDKAQRRATSGVVEMLHADHDRLIVEASSRLFTDGDDEAEVMAGYFAALERPVEDASLAFAAAGVQA